ncbi:MAG TPA: hypothetical protein VJ455_06295 [Ignavibacteria bacterium]|nr:hypothetical protein [Ignavibacteria bacterium]
MKILKPGEATLKYSGNFSVSTIVISQLQPKELIQSARGATGTAAGRQIMLFELPRPSGRGFDEHHKFGFSRN